MRISSLFWVGPLAAFLGITASAQDRSSLPSAPSSTLEQQRPPAPPPVQQPQAKPAENKVEDAKPQQPVLENLDPKLRQRVQPANNGPQPEPTAQAQTPAAPSKNESEGSQEKPFNIV